MERGHIKIDNPDRFMKKHRISCDKLSLAIQKATDKLASKLDAYTHAFPQNYRVNGDYNVFELGENNNWQCGMFTGSFIIAYLLTGNDKFLDVVRAHLPTYQRRIDENIGMGTHDIGFAFSPSCVAYYKLTGDESAKQMALDAAKYLYDYSFSKEGGFIIRSASRLPAEDAYRTMMDSLMNAPLFAWAGEMENNTTYAEAAYSQYKLSEKYLIRPDGSSYHHYQFDLNTHKPLYGVTLQGHRDESTWTRGHAWGIYGFPVAYDYTGDELFLDVHKDVTAYFLNHLPSNNIPYWDFDFSDGDSEPRDASAAVIAACGLLESLNYIPSDCAQAQMYENAAHMMLEAVIDGYTGSLAGDGRPYEGLMWGATGAVPFDIGIEGCAQYADYFYLEALLRLSEPEWKRYW